MNVTQEQIAAAFKKLQAVAEAIRDLGQVPSGHLYARLNAHGMELAEYEKIIGLLVNAKVVEKRGDLLIWKIEATK